MTTLITLLGKHLREGYEMKSKDTLSVSNEIAITSGRRYSHIPKIPKMFVFFFLLHCPKSWLSRVVSVSVRN